MIHDPGSMYIPILKRINESWIYKSETLLSFKKSGRNTFLTIIKFMNVELF